jgi:hypothetical protein
MPWHGRAWYLLLWSMNMEKMFSVFWLINGGEYVADDEYSDQGLAVDWGRVNGGGIDMLQWGDQS